MATQRNPLSQQTYLLASVRSKKSGISDQGTLLELFSANAGQAMQMQSAIFTAIFFMFGSPVLFDVSPELAEDATDDGEPDNPVKPCFR